MATKKRVQLRLPTPLSIEARSLLSMPLSLPVMVASHSQESSIAQLCDLERVGILGHGSEGTVYKVLHRKSSSHYALKVVRQQDDAAFTKQIIREVEILKKIDSPFIVRCERVFDEGGSINFVLEYMDGGSIASLLKKKKKMSESCLAEIAEQVLQALKYLHSERIMHNDIKPSNLLIERNSQQVKLADFGVSRIVSEQAHANCNSFVGTHAYMSPQRMDPDSYGKSYDGYEGDIWSLGVTLQECYVGHFPFLSPGQKPDWATLMCAICLGDPPPLPPTASRDFQSFIECCLQKEIKRRWTAPDLLKHPFINRIPK